MMKPKKKMEEIKQNEDDSFLLFANGIELLVEPKFGGRVTSLVFEGKEVLSTREIEMPETQTFGSVLWPSPQFAWGMWPPPYNLDMGVYSAVAEGDGIKLTSKIDTALSIQFCKTLKISKENDRIEILYELYNRSEKEQQFGLWEVTRLPKGGVAFFPIGEPMPDSSLGREEYENTWYLTANPAPYFDDISSIDGVFWEGVPEGNYFSPKIIADGTEGWCAYVRNGLVFIKQFENVTPSDFSPHQGEVEIYVDQKNNYVELEEQSSYRTIPVGGSTSWEVNWYVKELPEGIDAKIGNTDLVEFVRSVIK
ncbi:DUF4380 domain-containing protein [Flammeovirgaceae bacterium SG7u.111]|nr:DUF4380 domain-containing protein [Flammeovirgaceae bacterium SG7u.132]WPO38577.1 DUF4380 domain-containing protein [Flammeovirgaceae bacterium SG7u.111]